MFDVFSRDLAQIACDTAVAVDSLYLGGMDYNPVPVAKLGEILRHALVEKCPADRDLVLLLARTLREKGQPPYTLVSEVRRAVLPYIILLRRVAVGDRTLTRSEMVQLRSFCVKLSKQASMANAQSRRRRLAT